MQLCGVADDKQLDGRERNKRATRRALRAATLELALERGLDAVPIEEIAQRAGVSTRTFFNYFDTKDDAALLELFLISDEELSAFATTTGGAGAWRDLSRLFVADVHRAEQADGQDLSRYLQLHARHQVLAGSCITAVRVGLDQWTAHDRRTPVASHVAAAFAEFEGAFGDG